jgi:hypothetical protein
VLHDFRYPLRKIFDKGWRPDLIGDNLYLAPLRRRGENTAQETLAVTSK